MRKYIDLFEDASHIMEYLNSISIEKRSVIIEDDLSVSLKGSIKFKNRLKGKKLEELPIKFNTIHGEFNVMDIGLKTLKNCPDVVIGNFDCSYNNDLTSLEGGPKKVEGGYYVSNTGIEDFQGMPNSVQGIFVSECRRLQSLKGVPTYLNYIGDFSKCPSLSVWEIRYLLFTYPIEEQSAPGTGMNRLVHIHNTELRELFNNFRALSQKEREDDILEVLEKLKNFK